MKKTIIIILILIFLGLGGLGVFLWLNTRPDDTITRIGIGGGGAFLNPMIDPTDENVYYVTSDMGGLYYSHNKGKTWDRSVARGVFTTTHITDSGVVFAGGYGLYTSTDKGKTIQMIYPKNVKHSVSRCGWNENLMLADNFDNGYIKGIISNEQNIFFVTIAWEGSMRLIKTDYNGDNLSILYTEETGIVDPASDIDVRMAITDKGVYISLGTKIIFYNTNINTIATVYTTTGYIKDLCVIDEKLFFIDDLEDQSKILYTTNFATFNDLMDYNTLPTEFTKYGEDGTFNWHFKEIDGNNFNNIFLSFSSPVVNPVSKYDDTVDGIMKFNGNNFEWVFDSMYKTRHVTDLNGWSYGSHGPFYGIYASPHNNNICLVSNVETIYLMEYEKEETKKIKTLHCNDHGDGKYSTNGLEVQTTYFVKEDLFDKNHIVICTTDMGLQNSYDNGKTWQRMEITQTDYDIYNTCYDLHFDKYTKNKLYGLWSSRHDAPYNPTIYDKEYTKGAFAVSTDGGKTWDFEYSNGIPKDAIPVKMSVSQTEDNFLVAVATFNRGFYLSRDGGKNFVSINYGMEKVEDLIYGEDIVLTDTSIYCLTAPYLENGYWKPSNLYEYNISSASSKSIDLGDIVIARSLTYHKEKGLYINVIPTYSYKWFEEYNNGSWVNENGGIYHYTGGKLVKIFENTDGIFHSAFTSNGKMYATDTYGKIFVIDENGGRVLHEGLFTMLKNISFSLDEKIMYVTAFGGGTYRIKL